MSFIFENIQIVPIEEYKNYLNESKSPINDIDDISFIAFAIALKSDGIWSDDSYFLSQNKLMIFKTFDMIRLIERRDNFLY